MRLTIEQIDSISALKDKYTEADVVEIDYGIALSPEWVHVIFESGYEHILFECAIEPTGGIHT